MIPKKIYIAENSAKELCKKRYVWDCNASEELIDEGAWKINTPYILESEHNKQIEELKAENERQKNTIDFNVKENINILKKLSESIAENEKLKMQLHKYLDEPTAKTWTSPHDGTLTSLNYNGESYPIYADLKEGHTYMTDIVDGKATIIDITQNL